MSSKDNDISNSFLRRISSVVFFNQYGTDPAARAIWKPSRNALAFMRFPILFLCRMVSHTKIQFGFECDKNAGREIIIIVTTSFKKKSVLRCFPSTWKIKASVSNFLQFEAPFCGDGLVKTGGQTVKKDNLVLSTGLIMWIGHGKEIRKLHTVANSHSQPNW